MSFAEILEAVDQMDISEREMLIDIIRKRIIEQKRKRVISDVRQSRKDYANDKVQRGSSADVMKALRK